MVLMAIWFAIFVDARISFLERGWPVLNWIYDDAFFPFRKWLFNMGFAGKYYWQRYIADGARLLAGGILLYFALKGM
jgi:hypothetical protein